MQSSEDTLISIRIRRQNSTYFITCPIYENIDILKRKIQLFHKGTQLNEIRMYYENKLLDDKSNVHDQGLKNNGLVYYKLKKGGNCRFYEANGEWQDIPEVEA